MIQCPLLGGEAQVCIDEEGFSVCGELGVGIGGDCVCILRSAQPRPMGFASSIYDQDIGLVQFGARDYDAETG